MPAIRRPRSLVVAATALSLAACGSASAPAAAPAPTTSPAASSPSASPAVASGVPVSTSPLASPSPSPADLRYTITTKPVTVKAPKPPTTSTYPAVAVTGGADAAVRAAVKTLLDGEVAAMRKDFEQTVAEVAATGTGESEQEITMTPQPRWGRLLTVEVDEFRAVAGTAHPAETLDAITVDLTTGRPVHTDELFADVAPVDTAVRAALVAQGVDADSAALVTVGRPAASANLEAVASYPRPDGLKVLLSRCVAACALGPVEVTVPWTKLPAPKPGALPA